MPRTQMVGVAVVGSSSSGGCRGDGGDNILSIPIVVAERLIIKGLLGRVGRNERR